MFIQYILVQIFGFFCISITKQKFVSCKGKRAEFTQCVYFWSLWVEVKEDEYERLSTLVGTVVPRSVVLLFFSSFSKLEGLGRVGLPRWPDDTLCLKFKVKAFSRDLVPIERWGIEQKSMEKNFVGYN